MDKHQALAIEINRSLKYLAKMEAAMDPRDLQAAKERFLSRQARTPARPTSPGS